MADSKKTDGDYQAKLATAGKGESTISKMVRRSVFGVIMMAVFAGIFTMGHVAVCAFVFLLQALIFRELVSVRYNAIKGLDLPYFRTLQWSWFCVAIFYSHGEQLMFFLLKGTHDDWLNDYHPYITFVLYSSAFVFSTLYFSKGHIKYQMGQLCWTVVILCMTVLQFKAVINNIFTGLVWFMLPCSLVIFNDIAAYFCGQSLGRKIIKAPFLKLSPNKTWEGFLGAGILTALFAFYFPKMLVNYPHLICPARSGGSCTPHPVFLMYEYTVWPALQQLTGYTTFECLPFQLHSVAMAVFASLVAPFGGFFASAIKRAYKIKDFDTVIPGHGGVMDRMDCQFFMGMYTAVHISTFIRTYTIPVPAILRYISMLSAEEKVEVLTYVQSLVAGQ